MEGVGIVLLITLLVGGGIWWAVSLRGNSPPDCDSPEVVAVLEAFYGAPYGATGMLSSVYEGSGYLAELNIEDCLDTSVRREGPPPPLVALNPPVAVVPPVVVAPPIVVVPPVVLNHPVVIYQPPVVVTTTGAGTTPATTVVCGPTVDDPACHQDNPVP